MRRRALYTLLIFASVWGACAVALVRYGVSRDLPTRVDAIVVAGCAVRANDTPSDALARRVRRGIDLLRQNVAPKIVFTGGRGGGTISEAEASARLAEALGVSRAKMVLEQESHSTYEDALFARSATDAGAIVIVTDDFHVLRAERIFARNFRRVYGVGTTSGRALTRIKGALREVPLLLIDFLVR